MRRAVALFIAASIAASIGVGCAKDASSAACAEFNAINEDVNAGVADWDEVFDRMRDAYELAQADGEADLQRELAVLIEIMRSKQEGFTEDRTDEVDAATDEITNLCRTGG